MALEGALHNTERALRTLRRMRERATMLQAALSYSRHELESRLAEVELEAQQVEGLELALALSRLQSDAADAGVPAGIPTSEVAKRMPAQRFSSGSADQALDGRRAECVECSICQEEITPEAVVRVLPCSHVHHQACIDPWFERSMLCPVCRGNVLSCDARIHAAREALVAAS